MQRFGDLKRGVIEHMNDAEVYNELRFELIRLATALVGPSDAEDVVSTVITRILSRETGLTGLKDPRPYLFKAVINEARSSIRRRKTARSVPLSEGADMPQVDYRSDLLDVVEKLPVRQRAATFLVYWEGHTPTSAASLMGCRPATVRRYLHLARRKLKVLIDE